MLENWLLNSDGNMFQQRQLMQQIRFDGLLELRARNRCLQHFDQHLSKRGVLGRARLLAIVPYTRLMFTVWRTKSSRYLRVNSTKRGLK